MTAQEMETRTQKGAKNFLSADGVLLEVKSRAE